jgi:hypothetical protein
LLPYSKIRRFSYASSQRRPRPRPSDRGHQIAIAFAKTITNSKISKLKSQPHYPKLQHLRFDPKQPKCDLLQRLAPIEEDGLFYDEITTYPVFY